MSFLKSALVACVMATSAMMLGFFAPVAINQVHAQAVPFPPCVNDYRAEIAAGQRSQYYPRCVDDHGIPGRFMTAEPRQDAQPYNCPSGQVFSGGSCITIQNQSPYDRAWTSYFLGQTKCDQTVHLAIVYYCAVIEQDGRVAFKFSNNQSSPVWLSKTNETPSGLNGTSYRIDNYTDGLFSTFTAYPTGANKLTGGAPTGWAITSSTVCPACNGN